MRFVDNLTIIYLCLSMYVNGNMNRPEACLGANKKLYIYIIVYLCFIFLDTISQRQR